jgi:3-oxoadipate enol-lactonase
MSEHRIPTSLGTIHVTVTGTGDPIFMWPSMLTDHTLWDHQVAHFKDRYTAIAIDPPGHGRSDHLTRYFDFEECARVYVEILDALGLERAHVLGNSWGAMIGATIAATYPDRVGCAVLMNGTASEAPRRQRLMIVAQSRLGRLVERLPALVERRVAKPLLMRSVIGLFLGPTSRREQPDLVDSIMTLADSQNVRSVGFAAESVVARRPDQHQLLSAIDRPVLVLAGDEDATFPVAEVRRMAAAIPGAEFVVIERAAHLLAAEVPDKVNGLIEDFLSRRASEVPTKRLGPQYPQPRKPQH